MTEGDLLNFADLQHLINLTAERARSAQQSADTLKRILDGQQEILRILTDFSQALGDLISCMSRVEGVSTALAAYLSSRNGADLARLQQALEAVESDGGTVGGVTVHVDQQTGGTRAGEITAETDRDVNVSGGNIVRR